MNCLVATCEAYPEAAAFTLEAQIDIEEGTAEMFADCPLGDELYGGGIRGEAEFVAVGYFADVLVQLAQLRAELVEMPVPRLRRERPCVAGEGRVRGRE
jgi:hypothetical protein